MNKQKSFIFEYIPIIKRKAYYRDNFVIDLTHKKYDDTIIGGAEETYNTEYTDSIDTILLSNILYDSISDAGIVTLIMRKFLEKHKYTLDIIKNYTDLYYIDTSKNICCLHNFINNYLVEDARDNAQAFQSDTSSDNTPDNEPPGNLDIDNFIEQKNIEELNKILYVNDMENVASIMNDKINNKYNVIYLIGILHHLENLEIFLSKLKNYLEPDGKIIIKDITIDNNVLLAHKICGCTCHNINKNDIIDILNRLNLYKIKMYETDIIYNIELNV